MPPTCHPTPIHTRFSPNLACSLPQEGVGTYLYADGRAEVGAYAAHRDIGAGVRWSADRTQAWRMQEGHVAIVGGEISIAEVKQVARWERGGWGWGVIVPLLDWRFAFVA